MTAPRKTSGYFVRTHLRLVAPPPEPTAAERMRQLDAPDPRPRCATSWCAARVAIEGAHCPTHALPEGGEECDAT